MIKRKVRGGERERERKKLIIPKGWNKDVFLFATLSYLNPNIIPLILECSAYNPSKERTTMYLYFFSPFLFNLFIISGERERERERERENVCVCE